MTESAAKQGVDKVFRNARQANSIIILVGAGLSAGMALPDWRSVLEDEELARAESSESSQKLGQFSRSLPSTPITRQRLAEAFARITANVRPSLAHFAIAKLAPKAIVTTNFDRFIEAAIDASGGKSVVLTGNDITASIPADAIPVFKVHGSLDDPRTLILTEADFRTFLLGSAEAPAAAWLLRTMMAVSLVIVVGFPLGDSELGSLYEQFGDTVRGSWFILSGDRSADSVTRSLWMNRGVEIVDIANTDLNYFFEALKARLDSLHEPPQPVRQGRQILVSHIGDTAAVSTVYGLLRELNLDPVDIADFPMSGQTIIERFDSLAESSDAAVVILTPESGSNRIARSNLVFEIGLLAGKLGRNRVLVIVTPDAEVPSDLGGIQYFAFDAARYESLRAVLNNWTEHLGLSSLNDEM